MPKQAEDKPKGIPQPEAPAVIERSTQSGAIREYVLRTLGRPPNLFAVQVHHLWGDQYRVNVLVGQDASSVTIPHSYFVSMNSHGTFLGSQPRITKEYVVVKDVRDSD
jgi:hypothetical protein